MCFLSATGERIAQAVVNRLLLCEGPNPGPKKPLILPNAAEASIFRDSLLSSGTGFERGRNLRFLDIMGAERKTTEQGKFTEEMEAVRIKTQTSKH